MHMVIDMRCGSEITVYTQEAQLNGQRNVLVKWFEAACSDVARKASIVFVDSLVSDNDNCQLFVEEMGRVKQLW